MRPVAAAASKVLERSGPYLGYDTGTSEQKFTVL
jgi:hypothetical protein